jgi:hypothetical protein
MTVQHYDAAKLAGLIAEVWKNKFDTDLDPASGQWFTNGPGANNQGLIGGLTDALGTKLEFTADSSSYVLMSEKADVDTATLDNTDGLLTEGSVTLSHQFQDTSTVTHSHTHGIKAGVECDIKATTTFGDVTTKASFDYTFSWTDGTSKTTGESSTFSQTISVHNIPAGKVYMVTLTCDKVTLKVPFNTFVYLTGTSTANFTATVGGGKKHEMNAGEICSLIKEYKCAGTDSDNFGQDPNDPTRGYIRFGGELSAQRTVNFTARTIDVTSSYHNT